MYTDKHIQFINKHEFLSNSACSLIFTVVWSSHDAEKNPSPAEALRELKDVCWRLTGAALPSQWKLLPVPVQSNRYGCKPQTTESCYPRRQLFHGFYYFRKLKLVMYLLYGAHQGQRVDLTGQGYSRDLLIQTGRTTVFSAETKGLYNYIDLFSAAVIHRMPRNAESG